MPPEKFFVEAVGCKEIKLDAASLIVAMKESGLEVVQSPKKASHIILFTCGFIKSKEDISLKTLKYLKNISRPCTKIFVGGCLPAINPRSIQEVCDCELFTTKNREAFYEKKFALSHVPSVNTIEFKPIIFELGDFLKKTPFRQCFPLVLKLSKGLRDNPIRNNSFFIRISEGCSGNCTYCAIKNAHGTLRSRPVKEILYEFKNGLSKGYRLFNLSSKDFGAYGVDIGETFPNLLEQLFSFNSDFRLTLSSGMHLNHFVNHHIPLIKILKGREEKLKWLIIDVQSGSKKVLRDMGRPIDSIPKAVKAIERFKTQLPRLKLMLGFMVGFPGESEGDFNKTVNLLSSIPVDFVSITKFEPRPNTLANQFSGQLPESIKNYRARYLMNLARKFGASAYLEE